MTMNMLLLLTSWMLLLGKGHCLEGSSPLKLFVPSTAIHNNTNIDWKDIHDKISRDFQSYFKLDEHQKNRTQPCTVKVEDSGRPDTFKLNFQRNSITDICNFSIPLYFDYNGVDNLNPDVFDKLSKLAGLLLKYSNHRSLNVTISQDSDVLETVDTDRFSTRPFSSQQEIEGYRMRNKENLTNFPTRLFSGVDYLKVILPRNISYHELTEDLFWGSHDLKEIDLSNNYLRSLPENLLRDAHELRIFNLSCNQLMGLPDGMFIAANKLNHLDLSNNFIRNLFSSDVLAGLRSLQILNMVNNKLFYIDDNAFIALSNLRIANFSGNQLYMGTGLKDGFGREVSPLRHCHHLEELHLSENFVNNILSDWIFNHTKLRILDLSGNELSTLRADDLRFNSSNLYVDLRHNRISWVNLIQIGHIPKKANSNRNVTINLNWNPLYCNCGIYSLVRYLMNETSDWIKPEDLNYVKLITDNLYCGSDYMKYKRGKRISELSSEVLTCGVYEPTDRILSNCPYYCFCQIIPKFNMMKIDCRGGRWTPDRINTWHINFAYVDFANNSLDRIPDIVGGGLEGAKELYLDVSANLIDRIDEHSLPENLRGLVLDGNNLTETDMEFLKIRAPKVITEGLREKSWPCDAAIKDYQKYAIDRFKLNEPIDWDLEKFMCPDKTEYFADA